MTLGLQCEGLVKCLLKAQFIVHIWWAFKTGINTYTEAQSVLFHFVAFLKWILAVFRFWSQVRYPASCTPLHINPEWPELCWQLHMMRETSPTLFVVVLPFIGIRNINGRRISNLESTDLSAAHLYRPIFALIDVVGQKDDIYCGQLPCSVIFWLTDSWAAGPWHPCYQFFRL